jgi:GNAT superfamily N-acetyltransferase
MTMEYSLRNIDDNEVDWLYQLNEESYRDVVVRQFGEWEETFQRKWFYDKWRSARPAKIVAIGDDPIGVVVLEQRDNCDWLDEILLTADYRGQGIGTSLMKQLIADARIRNRPLMLRVLHENHKAKRLYERLGLIVIETLENHFLMEID